MTWNHLNQLNLKQQFNHNINLKNHYLNTVIGKIKKRQVPRPVLSKIADSILEVSTSLKAAQLI